MMQITSSKRRIRVLVVDENNLFREIIARGLATEPQLEVVGKAISTGEAREIMANVHPDIIISSIRFLTIYQFNIPVVFVGNEQNLPDFSTNLVLGIIQKPDLQSAKAVEQFIVELIKTALTVKVDVQSVENLSVRRHHEVKLIAIGASTGGTEALFQVLKGLPPTLPGIVIVQHIPPVFSKMFADRLNQQTEIKAKEAQTGDIIEYGHAYIAPGDQHMRIAKTGDYYRIECFQGERVNGHCPSVDVLFQSVAKVAGHDALGVILTGMGRDGANGLLTMRQRGSRTIGQDENSSIVYGMPKVAYEIGAVEIQLPLDKISEKIISLIH